MSEPQNRTAKDQFMLRLPEGLRDKVKEIADANNRSMNAEIVMALESWIERPSDIEREKANIDSAIQVALVRREHAEHELSNLLMQARKLVDQLDDTKKRKE